MTPRPNTPALIRQHLKPFLFCGLALYAQWDQANPKARCRTEACKGTQLPILNLDAPEGQP